MWRGLGRLAAQSRSRKPWFAALRLLSGTGDDDGLDLGADKEPRLGSQAGDLGFHGRQRPRVFGKHQFTEQTGELQSKSSLPMMARFETGDVLLTTSIRKVFESVRYSKEP